MRGTAIGLAIAGDTLGFRKMHPAMLALHHVVRLRLRWRGRLARLPQQHQQQPDSAGEQEEFSEHEATFPGGCMDCS